MSAEMKCPFAGGEAAQARAGARTNADWWPNQLNLKILNQRRVIHQASAGFPGYQQIEIAVFIRLATRHRAEDAQITRAMQFREAPDLFGPLPAQCAQRPHDFIMRRRRFRAGNATGTTAA